MIPTHSISNIRYKIDPRITFTLRGGKVIAGMIIQDADLNRTAEQKKNPGCMEIQNIARLQKSTWRIVKGGNKFTVKVESIKGGRTSAQIE